MGWEEDYRRKCPCPCGKGEREEIKRSNDWGQSETIHNMLCPICEEKYIYDEGIAGGHPGDFIEHGWVLKDKNKCF